MRNITYGTFDHANDTPLSAKTWVGLALFLVASIAGYVPACISGRSRQFHAWVSSLAAGSLLCLIFVNNIRRLVINVDLTPNSVAISLYTMSGIIYLSWVELISKGLSGTGSMVERSNVLESSDEEGTTEMDQFLANFTSYQRERRVLWQPLVVALLISLFLHGFCEGLSLGTQSAWSSFITLGMSLGSYQ